MTVGVITIPETMLARDVARLMHSNRINRVPVVREGTLLATRLAAYP
jgi:CBS domain-containing protein